MPALLVVLSGCGARTGLRQFHDGGVVIDDAPDVAPPPARCAMVPGLRAQVGAVVPVEVSVENVATPYPERFTWRVRSSPPGARGTVSSSRGASAQLTPDAVGAWVLEAETPYTDALGDPLRCAVEVEVTPQDPQCPGFALVAPRVVPLDGTRVDLAVDARWSPARTARSAARDAVVVATEDASAQVAAFAMRLAPMAGDLATVAAEVERVAASSVGATPVLVGRTVNSATTGAVRRSSFRVTATAATTALVLRDRVAFDLSAADPGRGAIPFSAGTQFVFEVSTTVDPATRSVVVLFAAAEEGRANDAARDAGVRIADFTDGSSLGRRGSALDVVCRDVVASRTVRADFLWLVDTSGSMDDDQERLGNAAERFFREMNNAGVDLRVGVVQAGSDPAGPDLDDPGFAWIRGDDPEGPRRLAYGVTFRRYHGETADDAAPYPLAGGTEEPLAAAVVTTRAMERRTGDPMSLRRFRDDAQRVAFFVTDESGNNDDSRFFARAPAEWGVTFSARAQAVTAWFRDHAFLTFGMVNVFERGACPNLANFVACVITGSGGGYLPLASSSDAEVSAALSRIVDTVAGAASEFSLDAPAISSTVQARLDLRAVPRSRADGFDVDATARTLIFRGSTYRPRRGQRVGIAAYRWR